MRLSETAEAEEFNKVTDELMWAREKKRDQGRS
jgi:hypothetical protein